MPLHSLSTAVLMALVLEEGCAMRNLVPRRSPFENALDQLRSAASEFLENKPSGAFACKLAGVTLVGAVRIGRRCRRTKCASHRIGPSDNQGVERRSDKTRKKSGDRNFGVKWELIAAGKSQRCENSASQA